MPQGTVAEHHAVVIVGTGFAGQAMAVGLKRNGIEDFVILERASGPGGTWRDNTYPGCQCDVPSHLYSLSFAPNPEWTSTYARQPEILEYLRATSKRFGVDPHVRWDCPMLGARWSDPDQRWHLETPGGPLTADVLVLGVGPLAEPSTPDLIGLDRFEGTVFHSARWDHDHDLGGERVAVVGTGASSIQIVPSIQPVVAQLDLYQRTPAWVLPHTNRPIRPIERAVYRRAPLVQKAVRGGVYLAREGLAWAMTSDSPVMRVIERGARRHIDRHIADPDLRERLTPTYEIGCKRILLSNTYYPAIAQPNVSVVSAGIRGITERGIVAADGIERPVDTIVLATGFRVTDSPTYGLVEGREGRVLRAAFDEHGAYLGTTAHGFPNLFVLTGPNTGIGHTSLVYMIESQVAYVLDALRAMNRAGIGSVEVRRAANVRFFAELQSASAGSVWESGCASWYLDQNGNNAAIWPGFTFQFRRRTRRFDLDAYDARPRASVDRRLAVDAPPAP